MSAAVRAFGGVDAGAGAMFKRVLYVSVVRCCCLCKDRAELLGSAQSCLWPQPGQGRLLGNPPQVRCCAHLLSCLLAADASVVSTGRRRAGAHAAIS